MKRFFLPLLLGLWLSPLSAVAVASGEVIRANASPVLKFDLDQEQSTQPHSQPEPSISGPTVPDLPAKSAPVTVEVSRAPLTSNPALPETPRNPAESFPRAARRSPANPSPANPSPTDPSPTDNTRMAQQVALFTGGANSIVSRTVGHAEGTRTADGRKTRAYQGHVDPGNGVWNLGSFSFQHCPEAAYQCTTPEEADVHQLRRLQAQAQQLEQQADQLGMRLNLVQQLNGIDLANQAPMAALSSPGYVALLQTAYAQGLQGAEAVLWARTHAYWNPQTNRWDAPGLGNREGSIRRDQHRRMTAIALALDSYLQDNPAMAALE